MRRGFLNPEAVTEKLTASPATSHTRFLFRVRKSKENRQKYQFRKPCALQILCSCIRKHRKHCNTEKHEEIVHRNYTHKQWPVVMVTRLLNTLIPIMNVLNSGMDYSHSCVPEPSQRTTPPELSRTGTMQFQNSPKQELRGS